MQQPSFPSAPGSPPSPSHKRHILHEDREVHEIKRRMGGLRFGEEAERVGLREAGPAAAIVAGVPATAIPPPFLGATSSSVSPTAGTGVFSSPFPNTGSSFPPNATPGGFPPTVAIHGADYSAMPGSNSSAFSVVPVISAPAPTNEEEFVAMDSDESGDEEEEEEEGGMNSQSSSISRTSRPSSTSSVSRIEEEDPRAVMLNLLYKRRPPRDKVEAKIENLIRYSLLRANPGVPAPPSEPPLSLCDKPWQVVEGRGNHDGGMDSSPPDLGEEGGMDL